MSVIKKLGKKVVVKILFTLGLHYFIVRKLNITFTGHGSSHQAILRKPVSIDKALALFRFVLLEEPVINNIIYQL